MVTQAIHLPAMISKVIVMPLVKKNKNCPLNKIKMKCMIIQSMLAVSVLKPKHFEYHTDMPSYCYQSTKTFLSST